MKALEERNRGESTSAPLFELPVFQNDAILAAVDGKGPPRSSSEYVTGVVSESNGTVITETEDTESAESRDTDPDRIDETGEGIDDGQAATISTQPSEFDRAFDLDYTLSDTELTSKSTFQSEAGVSGEQHNETHPGHVDEGDEKDE